MQLNHQSHSREEHGKEIIILCDHINSPANQGSLFRVADAFGVQEIIFYGCTPDLTSSRLRKTARSTEKLIPYSEKENVLQTLTELQKKGFTTVALEITSNSIPLKKLMLNRSKVILIIGNEQNGMESDVLDSAEQVMLIPMFGNNSSMNVIQAVGIALYQLID